jgi:hypothetical protein
MLNFFKIALVFVLFSGAFIYGMSWLPIMDVCCATPSLPASA